MKYLHLLILGFIASASSVSFCAPPDGSGYSWKTIFEDDFEGTSVDTTKWLTQHPWTRDYKGDAYERAENITVADGILTITAKAEDYNDHEFTSGAISTGYSKFRFKYGYAEARIKMPAAQGSWANFWMLSDGWPPEIDIVEFPLYSVSGDSNQRYRYITNIHYGDYLSNMATHWKGNLTSGYHTYALDWRAWYIAYYFDDSYVRSLTDFSYSNDFGSMYMILDYYVGGEWSGEVLQHPDPDTWPDPETSDSGKMMIDWVRVWQRIQDTTKECIGRWNFDETSGSTASDSAKDLDGTLNGGMTFENNSVKGNQGMALYFDGVDDYVDLPDGFDEFDNGLTFILWAKPTAAKNNARFIEIGNGTYANNVYFGRSGTSSDLKFKAFGSDSSTGAVTATGAIELNKWQHFAATIDTSGNVVLYKNGEQIQTGTSTWPWGVTRTVNYIGRSNWSADSYYEGMMDDVMVCDFAATAEQILQNYTNTVHCTEDYPDELDTNKDCSVDIKDFEDFAVNWLNNGLFKNGKK